MSLQINKKLLNNIFVKILLSIVYVVSIWMLTLVFTRLFIDSDFVKSWKITFILSPYLGAITMGFMAYKKGAGWKKTILFAVLGLTTTEKIGLIAFLTFYYLLGKKYN